MTRDAKLWHDAMNIEDKADQFGWPEDDRAMTSDAIPTVVLDTLEAVRQDGDTNMLARDAVMELAWILNCPVDAIDWLYDNEPRYMEALQLMGARRAK